MADEEKQNLKLIETEVTLDEVCSLDLTNRNETSSTRPKPYLKCIVCGDDAYGYNFDAISCESCKAFFRRNALRPPDKLKCRGNGNCNITVETRKRCKRCRLDKCFKMGMRKEWILSDEDKRKKKRKAEENRRRKQTQEPTTEPPRRRRRIATSSKTDRSSSGDGSPSHVTIDDPIYIMTDFEWSKIHQIQSAYTEAIAYNQVVGVPPYPATHPIHSTLELIRIPTYLSSLRLITYLKMTPEFGSVDSDDRVTLVKHNLLAVIFVHIVLIYDPIADTYHEHNTQDPVFQGKDWIEILGNEFYQDLTATATKLIEILEYDRVIVKLLLLIILYTKGFCGYDIVNEPSLNNISTVLNIHNMYTEVLYKYCLHQYGLKKTTGLFIKLINQLFAIQHLAIHLKDIVHSSTDASQLSPLMQSVLQLPDTTSPNS
ncbi:unnamed protein product [Adineta steineri]|uniref:Uncharacterized protein n=1 Tax=Adineta steineri TaxID=433720 RepID=A0A815CUW1_9BILA|nr:unnamed protein product [Adineta steineri]CAF3835063.1 unnamed protein product [Adineta steineri]CAF3908375.1 unnamed protein product [Adineta steineri]